MSDKDTDDWHDGSASLFRSARRAHDPTPADRAAFDRVLARIQDGAPPAATTGSGQASPGATIKLAQIAKVSLAVLGLAAAYFVFGSADHDSSASPASPPAAVAATASAASPTPAPRAEPRARSTPPPSAEPNGLSPTPVLHREDAAPTHELPRRLRTSAARHAPTKSEDAVVAEAPSPTPEARAATAPQNYATQAEPQPRSTTNAVEVDPATEPATAAPQAMSTELAVLKRMQATLRAADFTTTLALCAEHKRRWPHGTFELEREGVHAIAACGVSSDDAVPLAKAFLAKHPRAAIAMRVSSACALQLQGR